MRMIFVNLPVKNLEASTGFFASLGFNFNPDFPDDKTACMIVEENIYVMLLAEERFREFINNDISDATKAQEVLVALSASSRAEVDDVLARAIAAGGKAWKPIMDMGFMYGCSFQDLDGHVWEVMHMDTPAQ